MEKAVLIDGHSILNRAFYGVPDLTNSEGRHTNAVYGFLNILFKIMEEEQPDYLIVAFDVNKQTFRHQMYDAYKGTRKPMLPELREQVPMIQEVLRAMQIRIATREGYEADDVLGTLAKQAEKEGCQVSVISGDRDLLQLASGSIKIRIPKTKGGKTEIEDYTEKEVLEKYQVTPTQFIDVKALMGDASDNIPGVPGIGEKTATKLIAEYGDIEAVYAHAAEIKPSRASSAIQEHFELARLSKTLATIRTDVSLDCSVRDGRLETIYTKEALDLIRRLEFKSFYHRFEHIQEENDDLTKRFVRISEKQDFAEMERLAKTAERGALHWVSSGPAPVGLSVTWGDSVYWIPVTDEITMMDIQIFLSGWLSGLQLLSVMDLKAQLSWIPCKVGDPIQDLSVAAYLLNPLKDSYEGEDIARDYLNTAVPNYSQFFGKQPPLEAENEKPELFCQYVCYQAWTAYAAQPVLLAKLTESGMLALFRDVEMPLVYALFDMEQAGIEVNKTALQEYGAKLGEQIAVCQQQIYDTVGREFNINSPKQLGEILFGEMGLPGGKKTKTGFSTSAEVLEKLAPDYPVVQKILDYRQLTKLKSTYADGLEVFIGADRRIHGKFNQTITATGRISSTEPNLQNIPIRMELGREIRKVFVPKPGFVFIDADYSQIELRILAHMSGDQNLIEAYKSDQDIHRITAAKVFKVPIAEVTPLQRRNAKAVNFGIVYGISSFGLSQDLSITRKEANEYIEKYFETYPGIKKFLDESVANAKKQGYVTTMFGRRRPVPELSSGNFMQRSFGERIAMNSPIQGTAADIMKIAMIRVAAALKEAHLQSRIVLQVHDELLIETKTEEIDTVKEIVRREMSGAADLAVPLEIGMECGTNWYEAH